MSVVPEKGEPLLDVRGLSVEFELEDGPALAVDDLSFHVAPDEVLGIVGESGSGKSVAVTAVMRLLASNSRVAGGSVRYRGRELLDLSNRAMRSEIRGREISMIFQDPMSSLNPVITVGDQIVESLRIHTKLSRRQAKERAIELLETVGMPRAAETYKAYPHELSGGMRQRIMISMAIATNPSLIIADEPTTALDVTVQKQVIDLLIELRASRRTSVIFISHDLDLVADIADRIIIMYAGEAVESGPVRSIFRNPLHPYTHLLLRSVPHSSKSQGALATIEGSVPSIRDIPRGTCRIAPRIPELPASAHEESPQLREVEPGHYVRCTCYRVFDLGEPRPSIHGREAT